MERNSVLNWLREEVPSWGWKLQTWRRADAFDPEYFHPQDISDAINSLFSNWLWEQPLLFNHSIFLYEPEGGQEELTRLENSAIQHLLSNDSNWITISNEEGDWKWQWKLSRFNWVEALG